MCPWRVGFSITVYMCIHVVCAGLVLFVLIQKVKDHVSITEISGTSEAITVNKMEDTISWIYEISATVSWLYHVLVIIFYPTIVAV